MNIIFPLSVVYGIMGALLLCMNLCIYAIMQECMYIYVHVRWRACIYVCTSGE